MLFRRSLKEGIFYILYERHVYGSKRTVVLLCLLRKGISCCGFFLMMRYLQVYSVQKTTYYVNIAKDLHKPSGGNLFSESLVENLLNQQKNIEFLVEILKMLASKTEYAELCLPLKQPTKRQNCRNNKQNGRISLCKNKGVLMWKNLQA